MKTCLLLVLILQFHLLISSEVKEEVSLALTIYNDQSAMVKDVRLIQIDEGTKDLHFTDVSSSVQTASVTFKALEQTENIQVLEQTYEPNLMSTDLILQKYFEQQLKIVTKLGKKSKKVIGTLLGYKNGYILNTTGGIEVFSKVNRILFPSYPSGFITLPTITFTIQSPKAAITQCQVIYKTTGFSWQVDYSILLNSNQTKADFGGWITIKNLSGKRYKNAHLKFVAGSVNSYYGRSVTGSPFFIINQTMTLQDKQSKQVQLMPKVYGVPVQKYYLIEINSRRFGSHRINVAAKIQINNTKQNRLTKTLPKGKMKILKTNQNGFVDIISETETQHTPENKNIVATVVENCSDITANKTYIEHEIFTFSEGYSAYLNLTITNHKNVSVQIVVQIQNNHGQAWQFFWQIQEISPVKVSPTLFRISRIFKAKETFTYLWKEYLQK